MQKTTSSALGLSTEESFGRMLSGYFDRLTMSANVLKYDLLQR